MSGGRSCPGHSRPGHTAEVLKNGILHIGELARMDDDGRISIGDRKKDMLIRVDCNVYPCEVEAGLYQHDAVAQA